MQHRSYGTTGIDVSVIGFGGMRLDQDDLEASAALVKAAYDAGITYFDTAPGYGKSEDIFGMAFKEMSKTRSAKPFHVATKTGKSDPADIRRDLETSLERMGLDHIDFYHMWYVLSLDKYRGRAEQGALREFERLKDEGLIRNICVSTHMTGTDTAAMLADYPFSGVLLGYSAMNFAYRDLGIEAAAKLGRGVVVMNPLGGGIIPSHPERFGFVRAREEETVVEGALRFLINDPRITVALVGLSNEAQLREAISAVDGFRPIPSEKVLSMRENIHEAFDAMCTACGYCDDCPEGIPIPKLMEAYNHTMLTGDSGAMLNRLGDHWGISMEEAYWDKCVSCGRCEEVCTQHLPIVERLKQIGKEVEKTRQ